MTEMPRRANHEGTKPRKLRDRDLWRVRVMLDGRVHDRYGKTAKEAADKARKLVDDHERGLRPLDPKYTVGEWLADWLRLYCAHLAPRTRASYADTVRLYIEPAIGRQRLAKLHQDQIAAMLAGLRGPRGELGATSRRYVYAVLRIALGEAVRQERVHRNVATLVDPPAAAPKRVSALAADTTDALLAALDGHRHRALILTALAAGLREGELLGLTWPALDLERGTLEVHWQLERGTRVLVEPKRESRRRITLPPVAVAALREHRKRQMRAQDGQDDWDPRSFVFTGATGQPLTNGVPRRALQAVLRKLDLPVATTHQLRHSYATALLEEGESIFAVSKLLGHRDIATTGNVYGHLTDTMRDEAAGRMERQLRRAR